MCRMRWEAKLSRNRKKWNKIDSRQTNRIWHWIGREVEQHTYVVFDVCDTPPLLSWGVTSLRFSIRLLVAVVVVFVALYLLLVWGSNTVCVNCLFLLFRPWLFLCCVILLKAALIPFTARKDLLQRCPLEEATVMGLNATLRPAPPSCRLEASLILILFHVYFSYFPSRRRALYLWTFFLPCCESPPHTLTQGLPKPYQRQGLWMTEISFSFWRIVCY